MTKTTESNLGCPWCIEDTMKWICSYGEIEQYRCKICNRTITIKRGGIELVHVGFNS